MVWEDTDGQEDETPHQQEETNCVLPLDNHGHGHDHKEADSDADIGVDPVEGIWARRLPCSNDVVDNAVVDVIANNKDDGTGQWLPMIPPAHSCFVMEAYDQTTYSWRQFIACFPSYGFKNRSNS